MTQDHEMCCPRFGRCLHDLRSDHDIYSRIKEFRQNKRIVVCKKEAFSWLKSSDVEVDLGQLESMQVAENFTRTFYNILLSFRVIFTYAGSLSMLTRTDWMSGNMGKLREMRHIHRCPNGSEPARIQSRLDLVPCFECFWSVYCLFLFGEKII